MYLRPDSFLRYKYDSYLCLPVLRPSLERVWHPLCLILYGETMGSGGEELLCEQELEWRDRGSKSRMKTERERERGRKGAQKGDHLLTILSNHESDETLHEWQFCKHPRTPPPHPSTLPSSDAMSEKTATRNPSSRGKCKEKQETVKEWVPGFKQVPFFGFL